MFSVTTSEPVATVTLRVPVAAAGSMSRRAATVLRSITPTVVTVIPGPKSAVVIPGVKWVDCPMIWTGVFCVA